MNLEKISPEEFKKDIYPYYKNLFPENERKPYSLIKKTCTQGIMSIVKITNEDKFIGFCIVNAVGNNHLALLDYFAVLPEYQNRGYGTKAIKLLQDMYADYKGIFVEVESVDSSNIKDDDIRKRRIKFYEKLEFKRQPFTLKLFEVNYFAYILTMQGVKLSTDEVLKEIYEIYIQTIGKDRFKKYCTIQKC